MKCTVTCFERVLNLVKPLPDNKIQEGLEIIREYSFQELLDFGVENGCFTEAQSSTLYEGIVMWEDLEGNYWEEDYDKISTLYEKMGLDDGNIKIATIKNAKFVSIWDSDTKIVTDCKVDTNSHNIFDIETVDMLNDNSVLLREYVSFEGFTYEVEYDEYNAPFYVTNEYGGPTEYAVETHTVNPDGTHSFLTQLETFGTYPEAERLWQKENAKIEDSDNLICEIIVIEYNSNYDEMEFFPMV